MFCVCDPHTRKCVQCGIGDDFCGSLRNCTAASGQPSSDVAHGAGSELHDLLRDWLGIEATPDCPCRSMAAKMNKMGPDWCEGEGMPVILGVMRDEHAKRWAAGKTILPWADAGARQLVLLACRRARAKAG
jgi:hypothetical protein